MGSKAELTEIFGGRGAVLAEEVFHATQYLSGDVMKSQSSSGVFGLQSASHTTPILLEADAKIFATKSGMGNLSTSNYQSGYTIETMLGLIRDTNGDRKATGLILMKGTNKVYYPNLRW